MFYCENPIIIVIFALKYKSYLIEMKNLILTILFICTCFLPVSAQYIYRLLNTSIGLTMKSSRNFGFRMEGCVSVLHPVCHSLMVAPSALFLLW